MLKVTYGQLREQAFARGMSKLSNYPSYKDPRVAYNVAKINKACMEEATLGDELFKKLVDQYGAKEADGSLTPHDGKPGTFFIPEENQAEWEVKLKDFLAVAVDIDRPRLALADLADVGLTPLEIDALDSFISVLGAV